MLPLDHSLCFDLGRDFSFICFTHQLLSFISGQIFFLHPTKKGADFTFVIQPQWVSTWIRNPNFQNPSLLAIATPASNRINLFDVHVCRHYWRSRRNSWVYEFEEMVYGYVGRRTLMEKQEDIKRKKKEMTPFIEFKQEYLCHFNS